jgi:hypothetical protein
MSKSEQTITKGGASALRSKSTQKVLDIERRFIDDFMTRELKLHRYPRVVAVLDWVVVSAERLRTKEDAFHVRVTCPNIPPDADDRFSHLER